MRRLILLAIPALLTAVEGQAQSPTAANAPRELQIKVTQTSVHSGPSIQYPITGTLRKNAWVKIRSGQSLNSAFVQIDPPQGSISWIPKAVVTKLGMPSNNRQAFMITGEINDGPVTICPGGPSISDGPLMVNLGAEGKFEARRGTQGFIIGNAVKPAWDDRQWYPILPLPGESRYIPREAIEDQPAGAIAGARPPSSGSAAVAPIDTKALFAQAQQADQAGNIDKAIELYERVAREASLNNDGLANYCATRVYELRRKARTTGTLASRSNSRTSQSSPSAPEPPIQGKGSPASSQSSARPSNTNLRSTGAGYLRRTDFRVDNRATYALLDQSRRVLFYVTAEPGISLEPYVEHWVDLTGIVEVRGDVRGGDYMRVVRIALIR